MEDVSLLKFIRESGGVTVYDVMREYGIKRTAALYHLAELQKKSLIARIKRGRGWLYLLVDTSQVRQFIEKKIAQLTRDLEKLTSATAPVARVSGQNGEKLTLVFPNYYDLLEDDRAKLSQYYEILDYSATQLYVSPDEFIKRTKTADVIMNNFACNFTEEIAAQLPNLQYMHLSTHMLRYVDLDALKKRHIHLSNIPYSYKSIAVAEFVLAQTFALLRDTVDAAAQVRTGVNEFRYFQGEQLRGKKIIVFGTEKGTKDLVELFRSLGVEIGIYTEDSKVDPAEFGVSHFASQDEVFATGDIFYFSWTGDEYKALVGRVDRNFLDRITRPVYIVSVYKHKNIDYQRVRELMYEGIIKGIALDSYPEIQAGQVTDARRLMYLPNVLITPDIGWYTRDSVKNMNYHTTQRLLAYAQGNTEFLLF
jgi:phosphoglycerate dehydrogenase-like enzyme/predicted transcriptional regulator